MTSSRTMLDRIWQRHVVKQRPDGYALLYIDRHLMHDGSAHGFGVLSDRGLKVRRPERSLATPDHYVATDGRPTAAIADPNHRRLLSVIRANSEAHGVTLFDVGDPRQGIAHVVGPEQGLTQPGMTLVCGDSHTSTHGALGGLAFGIGASEVAHVMATQCLWQRKPRAMRITLDGQIGNGISAKDIVLAIIARIGTAGAVGHVIEYAGSAIRSLSIEGRLTVCNMSIEAGARAGMIAPDDTTFQYLSGRPFAPSGHAWDQALTFWRSLPSDADAVFDREVSIDAGAIEPMLTWGTSPQDAMSVTQRIPDPMQEQAPARRDSMIRALEYMGLQPGTAVTDIKVDRVFIGSCTNGRIEDLQAAARVVKGRRVVVPAWVVPGSGLVKQQAEAQGLDKVFREAGFEWRTPGCSMCVGMNGDTGRPGERIASTSNRNFAGRQGIGVRTHLVSPAMAAAAALSGHFVDVRQIMQSDSGESA